MTQSILFRDPEPAELNVSPGRAVSIILGSNDPDLPVGPPDLYVQGVKVVAAGVVVRDGASSVSNGSLGFDLGFEHKDWVPGFPITVRVVADDGVSVLDESWSFDVVDNQGPILTEATSPAPGAVVTASPGTIEIRITDPRGLTSVPLDVVDFSVADADAEHQETGEVIEVPADVLLPPAQQLSSASAIDPVNRPRGFEGRVGRAITIDGARRVIDSVQGPELMTYSGAQIFGNPVVATVYEPRGLDVWVDGVLLIDTGITTAAGVAWSPTITQPGSDVLVSFGTPPAFPDGTRVSIGVRVADGDASRRNTSIINYSFLVGNDVGPKVTNHSPAPGTRELSVSSPGSDLVFDITDPDGVDSATLNVSVNGVAAITAGAAAAIPYAGSGIAAITDGYTVTLVRSTNYTDGEIAVIDIEADDNDGVPLRLRTTSIVQYGSGAKEIAMNLGSSHLLDDDVKRVVSYDLTGTSFAEPQRYRHNGYGHDGVSYTEGEPDGDPDAAWHGAFGDFPISGWLAITATGWALINSSPPTPTVFMQSTQAADPGWSLAGNDLNPPNDGDMSSGDAVLVVAANDAVYVVDFTSDKAYRYDTVRRYDSIGDLSTPNADQSGGNLDGSKFLGAGPYTRAGLRAWQQGDGLNRVVTVGGVNLNTIFELAATKQAELAPETPVIERSFSLGEWRRIRVVDGWILAAGNVTGPQATAIFLSELQFAQGLNEQLLLDDMSTPSLPTGEMRNADLNDVQTLAFAVQASPDVVHLLDGLDVANEVTHDVTALGLALGTTRITAVALERGAVVGNGYLYAAVSESSTPDSRAVRWREHSAAQPNRSVVMIADGASQEVDNLSALGKTEFIATKYVCGYMELT
jgi:hypothetical protein